MIESPNCCMTNATLKILSANAATTSTAASVKNHFPIQHHGTARRTTCGHKSGLARSRDAPGRSFMMSAMAAPYRRAIFRPAFFALPLDDAFALLLAAAFFAGLGAGFLLADRALGLP